jgi:O-antigen biosynthesis protein WbqP
MYIVVKRYLDIIGAVTLLLLLSPVALFVAIWVSIDSTGPILFRAKRVGKDKIPFTMYKFRSMKVDSPYLPPNKFIDSQSYITRSGQIIRKLSLDEFPQLYNVIKGDMSFIGPRPGAFTNEDELIAEREKHNVFLVRPGISGWAQVNGRDELAHNIILKSRKDGEYVENISILMDAKCLFKTVSTVVFRKGYIEGALSQSSNEETVTA